MHELAIAQEIIRTLEDSAAANGISRIALVRLAVGKMSTVMPDALRFCFENLPKGPLLDGARLEIGEVEVLARCRDCGAEFAAGDYRFVCPACASAEIDIVAGRELRIESYEGE